MAQCIRQINFPWLLSDEVMVGTCMILVKKIICFLLYREIITLCSAVHEIHKQSLTPQLLL